MINEEKVLLTEREAADLFCWSVFTMREIRKRGEIDFIRFHNRTIRYTFQQLENYKSKHLNLTTGAGGGAEW